MSRERSVRVFVGRIPPQARERDVERFFRGFGRIKEVNLKNGFGFVVSEYEMRWTEMATEFFRWKRHFRLIISRY